MRVKVRVRVEARARVRVMIIIRVRVRVRARVRLRVRIWVSSRGLDTGHPRWLVGVSSATAWCDHVTAVAIAADLHPRCSCGTEHQPNWPCNGAGRF